MDGSVRKETVNLSDVKSVMREVYRRRGYIVLGQPARSKSYELKQLVTQVFNMNFGTEFEITESTDQQDWTAQDDLIAELRPAWKRLQPEGEFRYFRIKPAMRVEQVIG